MDNIKTILAGLSLTMAVGMPAAASDELTMVVGFVDLLIYITDWYLLRILIFYFFFYAAKLHKK